MPVTAQTILAASRVGNYFKASAINVFAEMGSDVGTSDAEYLLGRILRLDENEISVREMFSASSRSRFKAMADLLPAIDRLVDHGFLRPAAATEPTGGRPASPR